MPTTTDTAEHALILAPIGRDAQVAARLLAEVGIGSVVCADLPALLLGLNEGAGFAVLTEEALLGSDASGLAAWVETQPEWSDFPFVMLTQRGGGLERNPSAARNLKTLGNVTFVERPFHPTTLISLAESALRGRRRQYEARARLEALSESEQQFRTLADSIPTLCWSADADGSINWYNRQWYEYTGTTPADMVGWGWQDVHDPAILPTVLGRWRAAIAASDPFEMVFPLRGADGSFRPFLTRVQPVRDRQGVVVRWFGTNTDISAQRAAEDKLRLLADELEERVEQRTREREAAEDALRQAQKMEAIGQLTGGVAHDFNNLLTVIRGSVDLLRRDGVPEDKRARYIDAIGTTADRAAKLTGQLLAFSRRQALTPELFDAGASLREVVGMIGTLAGSRITIELTLADEAVFTLADRGQFDTAIVNMAINARDAMDGEGVLTITVATASVIPPTRNDVPVDGDFLTVTIADTGSGIAADALDRIFEPFYTTKGVGTGTGLGLSQVVGFARQSRGDIRVATTLGKGTVFTLYLPRASRPSDQQSTVEAGAPASDGKGARVLVVEDNAQVGTFATQALRELGYDSVHAADAAAALAELERGHDRFDIVVSDVVMPGMSGVELGREVRRRYADLPFILTSGYSDVLAKEGSHGFDLLHKPYSVEQLAQVLARAARRSRAHAHPSA